MKCEVCEKRIDVWDSFMGRCKSCAAIASRKPSELGKIDASERVRMVAEEKANEVKREKLAASMILTTDPAHKLPVSEHIDIVTAEVVVGMNIFKDFLSGVRNVVGGRTGNVQYALKDIRKQALNELRAEAAEIGADAVVGVDLNYNEIGATGSTMLMLVASGTAVKLEKGDE